jgi:amidohydrolase
VLSVGSIRAGEAFNIIPARATLTGTIRTFSADVRDVVLRRFEEIATGISTALGCTAEVGIESLTPALINDPEVTAVVRQVAARIVGEENLFERRTMGSEDMAFVNALVPGCFLFVGSMNEEAGLSYPHHNPRFDFDEDVLPLAVRLLATAAVEFLNG